MALEAEAKRIIRIKWTAQALRWLRRISFRTAARVGEFHERVVPVRESCS
jgi:hypothetical protein